MTFFNFSIIVISTFCIGVLAAVGGFVIIETKTTNIEHQQEIRVWHEYLKACEARMMYLDTVVDEAGIEVIQ